MPKAKRFDRGPGWRFVFAKPVVWKLLDRYLVIINTKLKKNKRREIARSELAGALITYFLLRHEKHIHEELAKHTAQGLAGELQPLAEDLIRLGADLRALSELGILGGVDGEAQGEEERAVS